MTRLHFLVIASALAAGVLASGPVSAACHHFTVTASPATVTEGGKVTVTVSRDAGLAASQIDVSTIDETAKAGRDYTAVKRTVSFTSETEQKFSLSTTNDSTDEPNETFRLHLSNPGGCSINTDFQIDPDARVTIRDNDAAPRPSPTTPAPRPTATTTTVSSPTAPTSPVPTLTESPSPLLSPSPTESPLAAAPSSDGGGLSGGAIAGIVIGAAALVGAATAVQLRRRRAGG
jgi:Calx-beta domain-containing protein